MGDAVFTAALRAELVAGVAPRAALLGGGSCRRYAGAADRPARAGAGRTLSVYERLVEVRADVGEYSAQQLHVKSA
jgi:hypothetical protein